MNDEGFVIVAGDDRRLTFEPPPTPDGFAPLASMVFGTFTATRAHEKVVEADARIEGDQVVVDLHHCRTIPVGGYTAALKLFFPGDPGTCPDDPYPGLRVWTAWSGYLVLSDDVTPRPERTSVEISDSIVLSTAPSTVPVGEVRTVNQIPPDPSGNIQTYMMVSQAVYDLAVKDPHMIYAVEIV